MQLKILYAAGENINGKIALSRFMKAIEGQPYIVKVAAYRKSSPKNLNIDWTLDCLHDIFNPKVSLLDNEYFSTYYEQVKLFNPDLIISDLEYFTSYIGNVLNTAVWQCSSSMLNFALPHSEKYNAGLSKYYHLLKYKNNQRVVNILDNSNSNFVYSHFGDLDNRPILKDGFKWVRPYNVTGKEHMPCQHNIVAGMLSNNKKILSILKKFPDSVAFTDFSEEQYSQLSLKDIDNQEEYACNLRNCYHFICEGQTSFLADAFYNNKYSVVVPNFYDVESIINSSLSEKLQLSKTIFNDRIEFDELMTVKSSYHNDVIYLHQHLENI